MDANSAGSCSGIKQSEIASYCLQGAETLLHMMIRGAGHLQARHPMRNPSIPVRDGIALSSNRGPKAEISREGDFAIAKRSRQAVWIGEMADRTIQECLE